MTSMESRRSRHTIYQWGLAALLLATGALSGSLEAMAESVFATAQLYEVRESINCNPGGTTSPLVDPFCALEPRQGFGTRIADATLVGQSKGSLAFEGKMTAEATSVISQVDWNGPAHGKIRVVRKDIGSTTSANFSGQLDLSLFQSGMAPFGPFAGRWRGTKGSLQAGGRVAGLFLAPVPADPMYCPEGVDGLVYLYPGPDGRLVCEPLRFYEFVNLGENVAMPLIRFDVTFFGD
jgi:hypothetical protein